MTSLLQGYTDTTTDKRNNATSGTSIEKAIRRWKENVMDVIIMVKDLHVCQRPQFITT